MPRKRFAASRCTLWRFLSNQERIRISYLLVDMTILAVDVLR